MDTKSEKKFFPQFCIIYAVQFLGTHERAPSGEVIVVVHFELHLDSCIHSPLQPHLYPNSQSQIVSLVGYVGHPIGAHVLLSHIVPIRIHWCAPQQPGDDWARRARQKNKIFLFCHQKYYRSFLLTSRNEK